MSSKRRDLPELQHGLLEAAVRTRGGKIWLSKGSVDTLSSTYAALVSLQRRKLIEPDRAKDPDVMRWKVTKTGREAVAPPKKTAVTAPKDAVAAPAKKAVVAPAKKAAVAPAAAKKAAIASVKKAKTNAK
jgi:hypothetical protein